MSNELDSSAFNEFAVLVTFTYGDTPTVFRYARWTDDITIGLNTFTAIPEISFEAGKADGSITDNPWTITMPQTLPPMPTMTSQRSHAQVVVLIEEVNPSVLATRRVLWKGTITNTIQNPNGAAGMVKATVSGWKFKMSVPLGIIADSSCSWGFGDRVCQIDLSSIVETGTISAIAGSKVTIGGLSTSRANLFQNGRVAYDGLTISIREVGSYSIDNGLILYKSPPPAWNGKVVQVFPGCDKKIATCRQWANEANFGGFGIAQQAYHPMVESPT